jgi:hypothetical protein
MPCQVGLETAAGELQYHMVTLTSEDPVSMLTVALPAPPQQVRPPQAGI